MTDALKDALKCGLLACCIAAMLVFIGCFNRITATVESLPGIVDARAAALQVEMFRRVDIAIGDIKQTADRADSRTGEALGIVRTAVANADVQIGATRADVAAQLSALNTTAALTAQSADTLLNRYQRLPDEIRADREYQGLVAETLGVLGATKITMGAAAKTANVIAAEAPKIAENTEKITASFAAIADDGHKFTNAVTKPKGFWGKFKDGLQTGDGLIRALGAAGVL